MLGLVRRTCYTLVDLEKSGRVTRDLLKNSPSLFRISSCGVHDKYRELAEKKEKKHDNDDLKHELTKYNFYKYDKKKKEHYLETVRTYVSENFSTRRGHAEFIYKAMDAMEDHGVNKDLDVYKALLDVFPKGKMVAQNVWQGELHHFPKQTYCAIDLLTQMEDNLVIPDREMQSQLMNIFGYRSIVMKKYWRMMYWAPKLKNLNPWPVPTKAPDDARELARLAIKRIISVDYQSVMSEYECSDIEDSIDDTWIISGMAPEQSRLIREHPKTEPVYVDGVHSIWIRDKIVNYFILKAEAKSFVKPDIAMDDEVDKIRVPFFDKVPYDVVIVPGIHEQEDATILAVCATGTSTSDSLLSWIRHLQKTNPDLADLPIVFKLKMPPTEIIPVNLKRGWKDEEIIEVIGSVYDPMDLTAANDPKPIK